MIIFAGTYFLCSKIQALVEIINENVSLDDLNPDQLETIEKNNRRVEQWPKFMVDYEKLSDDIKEKDRVYARKVYEICKNEFE